MGSEISCIYIARVEDGNPLGQFCTPNVRNEHFLTGPSDLFADGSSAVLLPLVLFMTGPAYNCRNLSRLFGQLF
jgi:hypothetical protein